MDPSQFSPSTPSKKLPLKRILLIISAILVLGIIGAFVYPILRIVYVQNNYTKLGSNEVTFTVKPENVSPGQSFSLSANFKKAYDFGNYGWHNNLSIINSANENEDVLLTPSELLTSVGYIPGNSDQQSFNQAITKAAAEIDSQSGIFPESTYAQLQKRRNDPNSFYIEDVGCGLGLGPPSEPPRKYSDKLTFVVLPQTPPGQYTILVKPGTYCNGLPIATESIQITVLPAT